VLRPSSQVRAHASPKKKRGPSLSTEPSKPRQRPTLPQGCPCSTIGPEKLNFRVRDGNGCDLFGIAARKKNNEGRSAAEPGGSAVSWALPMGVPVDRLHVSSHCV